MNRTRNLNKSMIAAAIAVAFAQPAFAQQAPEGVIQRVEITGSSIKRANTEAAAAVQTLTRADIERTGATTVLDVLRNASVTSTDINSATASSGSFATGSSGIDMRSLGKVATLVLVNGRRIAPYGLADGAQQNFTNLDAIAAEAIERIEILKDGASAIYGSDAIAGVINLILRKDYVGLKLKAAYSEAEGFKDLRSRNVNAIFGWGDVDKDGFNSYLSLEGYKRDGYSQGELRDHYPAWHRNTPGRSTWDAKSSFSPTGNYFLSSTNIVAAPGCPATAIDPADKLCKFDVLPYSGLTTNNDRWAAVSNTHFRIGKSIDAKFEITAAGATTDYIVAPLNASNGSTTTSSSIWYNVNGGKMVGPFQYPKLPVGHPSNPYTVPVEYRARLMDTGNGFNFNKTTSDQSRIMLALEGTLGDWDWKSAGGFMNSESVKATRAVSAKGYTDAIINKTYKFGQQNSYDLLNSMFPIRTTEGSSRTIFVDGTMTGTVAELPAGPLAVAVGFDARRQHYEMKSSDNVLNGELVGIFGLQVKDVQKQYALFTEATIPVVKKVELSAALRADKSGNADVHASPKLGLKYNAMDGLLFRATAAGGFRAPNVVESGNGLGRSSVATNVNDLRRCPTANALNALVQGAAGATSSDKALANSYRNADCLAGLPSFVSSNPDLKPETSKSFTVGAFWEPIKNTVFSLDYYKIERKDEIGTRSTTDILRGEANLPAGQLLRVDNTATDNEFLAIVKKYAPTTTLNFGGVGKLGLVYNPYVNTGKTKLSGLDIEAGTKFKVPNVGDLSLKLDANYTLKYQSWSVADNEWEANTAGTWDFGAKLNARGLVSLKTGAMTNSMTVNYYGGYSTNSIDSPTWCVTNKVAAADMATCDRVKSNTTVNYNLNYTGFKNFTLNLYVNNLFDKEQPVKFRDGWSGTSPQLRTFGFGAAYTFF